MTIEELVIELTGKPPKSFSNKFETYTMVREYFQEKGRNMAAKSFQSTSIKPTSHVQRSLAQSDLEHSVYQRSDYNPISTELSYNSVFEELNNTRPYTLMFASGMSAISSVMFYLKNSRKLKKLALGKNVYFETKWLAEDYEFVTLFDEHTYQIPQNTEILWIEFPLNCTDPENQSFNAQLNLKMIIDNFCGQSFGDKKSQKALVIDYTLGEIPFHIKKYLNELPIDCSVYLVTSLQKHRGYGLDLTNAGAVTVYNDPDGYEHLKRIRAITGTSITQETVWFMPPINNHLINKLISDSGNNAFELFQGLKQVGPEVTYYYSDNEIFKTSFIFIKIGKDLINNSVRFPFASDNLIKCIVDSAASHDATIVHGTSFGLPYTRIFKNSERYENTDSIRIAVGYDSEWNKGVLDSILEGTFIFLKSQ